MSSEEKNEVNEKKTTDLHLWNIRINDDKYPPYFKYSVGDETYFVPALGSFAQIIDFDTLKTNKGKS